MVSPSGMGVAVDGTEAGSMPAGNVTKLKNLRTPSVTRRRETAPVDGARGPGATECGSGTASGGAHGTDPHRAPARAAVRGGGAGRRRRAGGDGARRAPGTP